MLSIIVPVYNVAPYLEKCLSSIINQELDDYEVIIVNDGSTDNSLEICQQIIGDNPRFRIYTKTNGGLMSAWMFAIERASGDYFGFVDSDDYIHKSMFKKLYGIANKINADIIMCDFYIVTEETITPHQPCPLESGYYSDSKMDIIREKALPTFSGNNVSNARWNKIFAREFFLKNTTYCKNQVRILEDRFIVPPCLLSAKSFYYLQEPLYYYLERPSSASSIPNINLQNISELLYCTHKKIITDYRLPSKYNTLVERSNLNWLRIIIQRNFWGNGNFQLRYRLAQRMLANKDFQYCVKKYSYDLQGKAGLLIKLLYTTKCIMPFILICHFFKGNTSKRTKT